MQGKLINSIAGLSLAVLSGAAIAQLSLNPTVAAVGPESEVPVAIQNARWRMLDADINTLTFRNMDTLFTTREVARSGKESPLTRADRRLDFTYRFDGKDYTPEQFLDRTYTNALLVIKDGKIVHENYRNNSGSATRFVGWSMTKSFTSLLIGSALEEGHIKSLDDDITDYLPELKPGAYHGVTIRQILQMRSGVDYEERYDFENPGIAARNHITSLVKNITRFVDAAKTIGRLHPPGKVFQYKTLDTAVLGLLIERVTDGSVASYMTTRLWEPLGAEADGFFIMDGEPGIGREFTGAGFNAALRDYARIGLMMANQGRINGKQIVPVAWVKESTRPNGKEDQLMDYGYQWWTLSGTPAYLAMGLQGQFIFVDPSTNTVVVKLSFFPPADKDDAALRESLMFFQAVSKWKPER
jgi:hypothetical protein